MKAKCPFCENGCSKCNKGYFETDFAEGLLYNLRCKQCDLIIGFHIDNGNNPPGKDDLECACCITCEDPQDLEWVLSGYSKKE